MRGCAAQVAGEGCAPHSSPPPAPLLVEMPVLVGFHLGQTQHCILTLPAVVVGLLAIMTAAWCGAVLGGGELLEAGGHDAVQLLVLSSVGHHLVSVSAVVVALEAVEVTAALLVGACVMEDVEFAVVSLAGHATETLELVAAQRVQALVAGGVLDKSCLVAEPIVAILPHTVEVGLVLPVVAV